MVDTPRRDQIGLGIIGLGPNWEHVYREPLSRLNKRLVVRMVFDAVEARSRAVAAELKAEPAKSLFQILNRSTLQGILVLEPGWCTNGLISLITQFNRPAFLGKAILGTAVQFVQRGLDSITKNSTGSDGTPDSKFDELLMPELGLRFTPAACRLRELIATKLGLAHHVTVNCDLTSPADEIASIIDWCVDILGANLSQDTDVELANQKRIRFEFPLDNSDPESLRKSIQIQHCAGDRNSIRFAVECTKGNAELLDRSHLQWKTINESSDESLTNERTETEILIDQYCRRAIGGLNPIGHFSDYLQAHRMAQRLANSPGH